MAEAGRPVTVADETVFLVKFLPVIRRRLTRTGFVGDHVRYYSDALRAWIARRERMDRFVLRRDPRAISRVWALDPDGSVYMQVPYRTLARPPITVWEQRAATAARAGPRAGRRAGAVRGGRADARDHRNRRDPHPAARPDVQRRAGLRDEHQSTQAPAVPPADPATALEAVARPFEVIEQW